MKTWACINAIPNSRLEKATINPNGKAPVSIGRI
jgi:hypothetical protein